MDTVRSFQSWLDSAEVGLVSACHALSMWPEVSVGSHYPGCHLHNDLLPLLRPNRPRLQFRIFVVLVVKHQHREHASAVLNPL